MTRYIMAQDKTVRVRYSPLGTYFSLSKGKFYNPDTVVEIAMVGGYFLSTHIYDIHRASIFHQLSGT